MPLNLDKPALYYEWVGLQQSHYQCVLELTRVSFQTYVGRYYAIQYYTMLYSAIKCYTVLYYVILILYYSAKLCYTVM